MENYLTTSPKIEERLRRGTLCDVISFLERRTKDRSSLKGRCGPSLTENTEHLYSTMPEIENVTVNGSERPSRLEIDPRPALRHLLYS